MDPSLTGLTVVIKHETGEIAWGHMSSVQKWVRALGYPHYKLSSMVVFKLSSSSCFHSWLHFGRTLILGGSLDLHGGPLWISLIGLLFIWTIRWIYSVNGV